MNCLYLRLLAVLCLTTLSFQATCNTITNAISNITDCVNSVCTIHYSTLVSSTLSNGFSSCINFGQIKAENNQTLIGEKRFDMTVMKAGFTVPLDLQYVTGDISVTYDTYCTCNLLQTVSNCNNLNFTYPPKIDICRISSQYTDTCTIHKTYKFAQRIGFDVEPRYKVFLTKNFSPVISLHYTYDGQNSGIEWNGITPTHIPISSEMGFDLISSSTETSIKYPKYLALDMKVPFDLYDATGFNVPGEFSTDKFGAIYWLPDGQYKYKVENFETKFNSHLIKCDHTNSRSSLTLNYPRIDTYMENRRLQNDSIRGLYSKVIYYDENSFSSNDFWSSNVKNPSHLTVPKAVYSKAGSANYIRNYIQILDSNLFGHKLGVIGNSLYIDDVKITSTTFEMSFVDCDFQVFKTLYSSAQGLQYLKTYSPFNMTLYAATNTTYMDWEGNCRSTTFGFSLPEYIPIHDDKHHLFISYNTPGSFTYRVYGALPGISFSTQLCPEISAVKDDTENHFILITARSTCGSGEALVMSNNSLSHGSQAIMLTETYKTFKLARLANISDIVSVGICSLENCAYKNLKISGFKYIPPTDNVGEDGVETPSNSTAEPESIFGSASDFWNHIKDSFSWNFTSWRSILLKVFVIVILVIVSIIIIMILIKLIPYFKKLIMYFFNSKKKKAKYI